jgi:hypothetical protein
MKLSDLKEMTMKAGDLSSSLKGYFEQVLKHQHEYEHVGDIEGIKVLKKEQLYLLMSQEVGAGFFEVKPTSEHALLNVGYIAEEFRGKGILEKFILFLKIHENFSKILLGDVHSVMMVTALKKLSKKFKASWVKGAEKVEYDPANVADFYHDMKPTGDFRKSYDWLLE